MSSDYTSIVSAVKELIAGDTTRLNADLTTDVVAVRIGEYVPSASVEKPVVYVRLDTPGLIADMAGGRSRLERLMMVITGAATGATQEDAHNQACNLMNNVQNILCHNVTTSLWGASYFGWSYSDDDASPEAFGRIVPDVGAEISTYHWQMRWSADVRITRDE